MDDNETPPSLTFGIYAVAGLLLRVKKTLKIKNTCDIDSIKFLIKLFRSKYRQHFVQPFIGSHGIAILSKVLTTPAIPFRSMEYCFRLIVAFQRSDITANYHIASGGFIATLEDICTYIHTARIRFFIIYILTNAVFNSTNIKTDLKYICNDLVDAQTIRHIKTATTKIFHLISRLLRIEHADTKLTAIRLASALMFPHHYCLSVQQQKGWVLFSNEMTSVKEQGADYDYDYDEHGNDRNNDNFVEWTDILHSALLR